MRITLVRHGESEANVGNWDYQAAGDHRIPLTAQGRAQAVAAGTRIAAQMNEALVYCSPYLRTRETLDCLYEGSCIQRKTVYEDARLRETEHGYSDSEKQQDLRRIHGWFYYRYEGGESPADCFDRTCTFMESMMRQVDRKKAEEVLIVTHGLTIRCFLMRFLHLSVEEFESLANPSNCDIITIDLKARLENPVFTSGRWGVEGIKLRSQER